MTDKIYCSTGCLIGRENGFNYRLIAEYAPLVDVKAFELMMLKAYYEHFTDMACLFDKHGLVFPILHADKQIGDLLSYGTPEDVAEGLRLFKLCCGLASDIGAKRVVLHLWGGQASDYCFTERNLVSFKQILEIADMYRLCVLVENIPCVKNNPLTHWDELEECYGDKLQFIFDTRFGGFHEQLDEFAGSDRIERGIVTHMHISDYTGPAMNFKALRPILHPGEGIIDFVRFFSAIRGRYTGSITLESPVLGAGGSEDFTKLNNTLSYIRKQMQ